MIYKLTRMVLGSSDYVEISDNHFRDIEKARDCLIEALYIEEKFSLVVDNYLEFEVDLLEGAARTMVRFTPKYSDFQMDRSRINRRLINLLSTCKSYVDQTRVHIKNMFGRGSEGFKAFQHDLDSEEGLGYKVMSEVRNFAQHRGYPIQSVSYPAKWTGTDENAKLPFSMVPFIELKEIQEDPQFDRQLLKQLMTKDPKIDVRPLMRDYLATLGGIHEKVRVRLRPHIDEWEVTLLGAIERYRGQFVEEKSIVGLVALAKKDNGTVLQEVPLTTSFIEYRKDLEMRTSCLSTLSRRYVTSEGEGLL